MKTFFISMFMLIALLIFLNLLMSENFINLMLESFIYECGFDSIYWSNLKISIHFFKLGFIFIMFDLEIMYLLLIINNVLSLNMEIWLLINFLMMTFFMEMYLSSLKWSY